MESHDVEAFGALVRKFQGLVFGVALHMLGNIDDAQDATQDAFVRAFTRIGQLKDPAKAGSWLRQICVNECRASLARRPRMAGFEELGFDPFTSTDARLDIQRALASLDEASRLTVVLFYLQDHSMRDIGAFLDEPVTTIKSRLRNARMKLRKEMEEQLSREMKSHALPDDFGDRVTRLLSAVTIGDEDETRRLLAADPRLAAAAERNSGQRPLHVAAAAGRTALVELFLGHGADPNALDIGDNASPLHYACERGRLEVVKLLVEAGSDVNWDLDLHQLGPLGWAVAFGTVHVEIAEYLLAHGARLNIFTATALGRAEEVRRLIEENPVVLRQRMSRFELFRSPIEFAAQLKQKEIAMLMVSLGADVSLSEAAALGHIDLTARRLEEKPTLAAINLALKFAVQAGELATTRLLVEQGGDANYAPQGTSLLFDAIGANDEPMARQLIELGADLEFKDRQWNSSPLGWQVFFGRPEETRLALRLGAEVADNLVELAEAGRRGELRRWSTGTPSDFAQVIRVLKASAS